MVMQQDGFQQRGKTASYEVVAGRHYVVNIPPCLERLTRQMQLSCGAIEFSSFFYLSAKPT
jgi:hypothetical protein